MATSPFSSTTAPPPPGPSTSPSFHLPWSSLIFCTSSWLIPFIHALLVTILSLNLSALKSRSNAAFSSCPAAPARSYMKKSHVPFSNTILYELRQMRTTRPSCTVRGFCA